MNKKKNAKEQQIVKMKLMIGHTAQLVCLQ